MYEHIGRTEKIGDGFELTSHDGILKLLHLLFGLYALGVEMVYRCGQESAGSASEIAELFTKLWIKLLHNKLGDGAGSIVLSGLLGGLHNAQHLLIHLAEEMALFRIVIVQFIHQVYQLAKLIAIPHMLGQSLEHLSYNHLPGLQTDNRHSSTMLIESV